MERRETFSNLCQLPQSPIHNIIHGEEGQTFHDMIIQAMDEIEENKGKRNFGDLPQELLSLVKCHLFGRDYNAFSAVCKSWRSTVAITLPRPLPLNSSSPCLMYTRRDDTCCLFYPQYNYLHINTNLPQLHRVSNIYCSKYGWALMSVHRSIFFFNLFTREKIDLPDFPEREMGFAAASFTTRPDSPDCKVIGIATLGSFTMIGIIRRGQNAWHILDRRNSQKFMSSDCSPVYSNGLFYVLGITGNIGIFDPKKLTWNIHVAKPFMEKLHPVKWDTMGEFVNTLQFRHFYLVEIEEKLVAIVISRDYEVHFFTLSKFTNNYVTSMDWKVELHGLGDNKLFLSRGSALVKKMGGGSMSNKICFPGLCIGNRVVYCIKTRKFLRLDGSEIEDVNIGLFQLCCAWIEPNFQRVGRPKLLRWYKK